MAITRVYAKMAAGPTQIIAAYATCSTPNLKPLPAMQKRDVIRLVLEGKRPPYVPWSMGFTQEAKAKLQQHYGCEDLEGPLENHLLRLGNDIGFFDDLGNHRVRDVFGVVWDRSIDRDIGNVEGCLLP